MKLRIATRELMDQPVFIEADSVLFISDDEREAFEVRPIDGGGLDVRGAGCYRFAGELRSERLEIRPCSGNVVQIFGRRYDK